MNQIDIIRYPAIILRQKTKDVLDIHDKLVQDTIEKLIAKMGESSHCVGLAANQIGSDMNMFVADASKNDRAQSSYGFVVVINPKVEAFSVDDRDVKREGCMSIPDLTGNVSRAKHIQLSGMNEKGESIILTAHDFEARVFQHEYDHLQGKVFLDRVKSSRDLFARKVYR